MIGTQQPAISRIEKADYQSWSFSILRKIAGVLDARIRVLIEPSEDILQEYDEEAVTERTIQGAILEPPDGSAITASALVPLNYDAGLLTNLASVWEHYCTSNLIIGDVLSAKIGQWLRPSAQKEIVREKRISELEIENERLRKLLAARDAAIDAAAKSGQPDFLLFRVESQPQQAF